MSVMISTEAAERRQYLSFALAGSDYAVAILQVKEILQYEAVTPVPSVPRSVRGVINLRGAVVPVIDLAVKFGLAATPVTKRTCIVIVEAAPGGDGERTVLGVVADAVREVLELGPRDIEPPPPFGTHVRVDHLLGMGKSGKGFVLLLDLDCVLAGDDLDLGDRFTRGEVSADGSVPDVQPGAPAQAGSSAGEVAAVAPSPDDAQRSPQPTAATGAVPRRIEQAARAHLQWKARIKTAIACGKLSIPVSTLRAEDACEFGKWLHGGALPAEMKGSERLAEVKRLHRRFHQATATVAELALAGRRGEAERALAEDGSFTAASNALLEALRAWR